MLTKHLTLSPGANTLAKTMSSHGATTALVSGGFTLFTRPIAERAGFQIHRGNQLDTANGSFTGRLIPPILGKEAKKDVLLTLCQKHEVPPTAALAIGDGANDLAMIETAGLGIAYKAKSIVAEAADVSIQHTDLVAALYYQGYRDDEIQW